MTVHTFPLGELGTNCYILQKNYEALVIDPGGTNPEDFYTINAFLKEKQLSVTVILCTHLHYDHIFSTAKLHDYTEAPIFASSKDNFLLKAGEVGSYGMWRFPKVTPFQYDNLTEGNHTFGSFSCEVLSTPGHTPGCLSLYFKDINILFTGDLLFYHSVGRTDLPGGNTETLLHSLYKKIFVLPQKTVVYPGHGQSTSVQEEQLNNPYLSSTI